MIQDIRRLRTGQAALAAIGFALYASAFAFADHPPRHEHPAVPPGKPRAQHPINLSGDSTDAGHPIDQWQHATGDWGGLRPQLEQQGITFEGVITADWSANLMGGASTNGDSFRHLLSLNLTLDTERLGWWQGGTVFVNFLNHNGESGSGDPGDFQGVSNIDAPGRTQVAELWIEQLLLDGRLRLKAGKIEANSDFAYPDHGGEFLNSSPGLSPTLFVLPTDPDPATGVVVFVYPDEHHYAGFGVFDGALQEGVATGERGPKTFFASPADTFVIVEAGKRWAVGEHALPGRVGIGAWHHTGTFVEFNGSIDDGTEGFYLTVDQVLWRENPGDEDDEQGVAAFFQYGLADGHVSAAEHHIGGGVVWIGALPGRDDDALGAAFGLVIFSDEPGAAFSDNEEVAIEFFYKCQATPWISVKPDLQYILNPGGISLSDALVATVRCEVVF